MTATPISEAMYDAAGLTDGDAAIDTYAKMIRMLYHAILIAAAKSGS